MNHYQEGIYETLVWACAMLTDKDTTKEQIYEEATKLIGILNECILSDFKIRLVHKLT